MSDKAINIIAGILLTALVGVLIYFGVMDTYHTNYEKDPAGKSVEQIGREHIDKAWEAYQKQALPILNYVDTVGPDRTKKYTAVELKRQYNLIEDKTVVSFVQFSNISFDVLSKIAFTNRKCTDMLEKIYPMQEEIIRKQIEEVSKVHYKESLSGEKYDVLKILQDELADMYQIGNPYRDIAVHAYNQMMINL